MQDCVKLSGPKQEIQCQGLVIKKDEISSDHCIVFLSGTGTQLCDTSILIESLADKGYTVAAIERFIGGISDVRIKPQIERKTALSLFLHYLTKEHLLVKYHIIAHSYAAFEIIRLLADAPEYYRKHIQNIILINPAGFNETIRFVPHCLRFTFLFILKEYIRGFFHWIKAGNQCNPLKVVYANKLKITHSLFVKTIQNPVRTYKEVADIVSFKIKPYMQHLIENHDYRFHFVLNTGDELIPISATLGQVNHMIPEDNIMTFPGNHMDLLVHKKQIHSFIDNLERILGAP